MRRLLAAALLSMALAPAYADWCDPIEDAELKAMSHEKLVEQYCKYVGVRAAVIRLFSDPRMWWRERAGPDSAVDGCTTQIMRMERLLDKPLPDCKQ